MVFRSSSVVKVFDHATSFTFLVALGESVFHIMNCMSVTLILEFPKDVNKELQLKQVEVKPKLTSEKEIGLA